jgi:hypothetical protein
MPSYSGFLIGRVTLQSMVAVQDQPMHQLGLSEIRGTQRCTDEKWNGATLTYWNVSDLFAGNGPQRGYWVNDRSDGDRDWGTFEGRVLASGSQVAFEGAFKTTGGSGRFTGITGEGRYRGTFTSPTEAEVTWEGSYQLAAAGAAGAAGR